MNPDKNKMLNGINTQAAEQLFSWLKNYANILSNLGWRRMPIYLLLLFHYKNLERMKIRPTQVSCIPNTPTISLAHTADAQQVRQYEVSKIQIQGSQTNLILGVSKKQPRSCETVNENHTE
ncbi:unnamed protein product, partial [Rotaria socialis]